MAPESLGAADRTLKRQFGTRATARSQQRFAGFTGGMNAVTAGRSTA
jgi:hypothetical protein